MMTDPDQMPVPGGPTDPMSPRPKAGCGTYTTYQRGCRCEQCRAANAAAAKAFRARRRGTLWQDSDLHGTRSGYENYSCRCHRCTAAHRVVVAEWKSTKVGTLAPNSHVHGTLYGYCTYACRCTPCCQAISAYHRDRYQQRRSARQMEPAS